MSEDSYFYGGNGEEAFTVGLMQVCYACGKDILVKISDEQVKEIVDEHGVNISHARALAFDKYKKHQDCESDGVLRGSYILHHHFDSDNEFSGKDPKKDWDLKGKHTS